MLNQLALIFLLLTISQSTSRAADVLENVPNDALGFMVVKHVAATDAKIEQLLKKLQVTLPGPLAFFKAITGVNEGLDSEGDFLFVVLPAGADAAGGEMQFAVWLPVKDYDRLLAALGGTPNQGVTAVTVAGEDVLVGRHGAWALVMDPNQRDRMEQIRGANPQPLAAISAWRDWIDTQDVSLIALPSGVRVLLQGLLNDRRGNADDDPFGFGQFGDTTDTFVADDRNARARSDTATTIRATVRKWLTASPKFFNWLASAQAIGISLQLDESGNATAGMRIKLPAKALSEQAKPTETPQTPPALYEGGNFVLNGAGTLPPELSLPAAQGFVHVLVQELRTQEGMRLRAATVHQFQKAVERAMGEVESAVVLTQPGDKLDGVYTNDFLVVRTPSANSFVATATDVMRLWNSMNRDAEASTQLVFDLEDAKIGQRAAKQYSLDIAAADGAPALPEIRQAMEKLFGAGGKLRLWIVLVDDQTVLLASATPEQVTAALAILDRKQPVDWERAELEPAKKLLPVQPDWRLFFSPHGYNQWHRRQMDAITGPVLGGPLVKDFPASPPIGIAGGVRDGDLWIDAAVPAETINGAGTFFKNFKKSK